MSDNQIKNPGRRRAMECLAWAGAGVLWTVSGGIPTGQLIGSAQAADVPTKGLHFVQISDTHFGFNKEANPDVAATARAAIGKINALPTRPDFVVHTGDLTHLSKPAEFDIAEQVIKDLKVTDVHYIPGEHDVIDETPGALYRARFAKGSKGAGWYSFDQGGVHFVALVNVMDLGTAGLGQLGREQIDWLEADLKGLSASTPLVIFAHMPLWSLLPSWGWGTADAEVALSHVKRFGSVTVLNGHIHQVIQKVEGNVAFHTAMSTAFPQPKPGEGTAPGPLKVPAERLGQVIGIRTVDIIAGKTPVAIIEHPLAGA